MTAILPSPFDMRPLVCEKLMEYIWRAIQLQTIVETLNNLVDADNSAGRSIRSPIIARKVSLSAGQVPFEKIKDVLAASLTPGTTVCPIYGTT
jgi:hypothetical protein